MKQIYLPVKLKIGLPVLLFLSIFSVFISNSQIVTPFVTKGDKSKLIEQQPTVIFTSGGPTSAASITVNENTTFQKMDGFGWCLTEASTQVISGLGVAEQTTLLNDLFNPTTGLNSKVIRIPIGASDLSSGTYTYNEVDGDVSMNNFSLSGPDLTNLVPILQKIVAINPTIKIIATPWTAPTWMKTSNTWIGGSLKPEYYEAYGKYFVKYIQAMNALGINIWAITPQNEPGNPNNEPSMVMTSTEQKEFINNQLGPQLVAANFSNVKIIAYDHNCDITAYPIDVLNNSNYVDGAAFHLYAGDISAMSAVKNATGKNVYFTEQYTGSNGDFSGDFGWHTQNVIIGSANNWGKTAIEWNLAADLNNGPKTPGGCSTCLPAITVANSTTYTKNVSYYIIGQISKFVKKDAFRIASSSTDANIKTTGFRNPDGSIALLAYNTSNTTKNVSVVANSKTFNYDIPAASAVTFNWSMGESLGVTGLTISPATKSLAINNSTQLNATVSPSNATNLCVNWASSNPAIAKVNESGFVTGISFGTATITGTTVDGAIAATAQISVSAVPVSSISVAPTSQIVYVASSKPVTATILPVDASNKEVTWSSSNMSIATVSSLGVITGVAVGTVNIIATAVDGGLTAVCSVVVKGQEPYSGTPIAIPGIIQAENFDNGGQNVSYFDNDESNNGGAYRTERVDISTINGSSTQFGIGWTGSGEWIEYTVNVTAGTYDIIANIATPSSGKQLQVLLDGAIIGTINVTNTGGYGNFQNVTLPGIVFSGGTNKVLRLQIIGGDFNIDQIEIRDSNLPITGYPGYYNIVSKDTGRGVDAADYNGLDGGRIQQYDLSNNGGNNQRFSVVKTGANQFYLKVKSSGMCLAPATTDIANGVKVVQKPCSTTDQFKWTITKTGSSARIGKNGRPQADFVKIENVLNNKALNASGWWNGADMQVWEYGGGNNEQWTLFQVEAQGPLPVDIISFKAAIGDDVVNLNWKVANEKDFSHFEVQKSENANEFNTLGQVNAANLTNYNFQDNMPSEGNNYYRLKMVDLDGSSSFTKVINVKYEKNAPFITFENPAINGAMKVVTNLKNPEFQVFSLAGVPISYNLFKLSENNYNLKIQNKQSGMHLLNIVSEGKVFSRKILLQ
jgi:O-glycosyl hydrolase